MDLNIKKGSFVSKFISGNKSDKENFSDIALVRKLLSNEKAKILYAIKIKKPKSIYELAKILGRDFKSVRDDVRLLERFGFISFHTTKKGKRTALTPTLNVDKLGLIINI